MRNLFRKQVNNKLFIFLDQLIYRFVDHLVIGSAAELTYFLILSIFPFLIALLNILNYFSIGTEVSLFEFLAYIPTEIQSILKNFIADVKLSSSEGLLVAAILGAVLSSSTGFRAIIRSLNKAYDYVEGRGFIKKLGVSIFLTLILILIIIVVLISLVLGELIGKLLFQLFNLEFLFLTTWQYIRYLIAFIFMVLAFAIIYKWGPNVKDKAQITIRSTLSGAIFTSISWIVMSLLFSFYLSNFNRYSVTYGSLGGIIIMLVWLFISSIVIILGGEINATLENLKSREFKPDYSKSFFKDKTNKN